MAIEPVGQPPRKNKIQEEQGIQKEWNFWFEQVRANLYDIRDFELTINPSSVGATTTDEQSFTAVELNPNDAVLSVNKPSETTGLIIANYRAGDDTLFITFANVTGGSINPPEEDYLISILKR